MGKGVSLGIWGLLADVTQFGCVGWNSYLSLLNQKKGEKPEVSEKAEELLA